MNAKQEDNGTVIRRIGYLKISACPGVPIDEILRALRAPGEVLKSSRKTVTRRVGKWVLKESRLQAGLGILKHTLFRKRYRQAWEAARHLARRCVNVPKPRAFIEKTACGIIAGNILIADYLEGCVNVETFAPRLQSEKEIAGFLQGLAVAVNALEAAAAYHTDLSGKNIFTRDGARFFFLDLDGVLLEHPYPESCRMKNHVQLYDSFCDRWPAEWLDPFIARMIPSHADRAAWLQNVHEGQAKRRAAHQAREGS